MKRKMLCAALAVFIFVSSIMPAAAAAEKTEYMKIYHIDCGRKYFSVRELCEIIDVLALNDYSHLQLAFGNNGLRFLPEDMSVEAGEIQLGSEELRLAVMEANRHYTSASLGELSEADMDAVIAYAESRGVDIIPMLNSPGHMNALLYAMEKLTGKDYSYCGSGSTVDVCSAEGVCLTQAVVKKYIEYFAEKGCTYFNMGADEYANDIFSTGSMGFGKLIEGGQYGEYADYLNSMAELITSAGMTPMAFNDGIYFDDTKSCGGREVQIDTGILVCYWQSGWGDYTTRSAQALADDGFRIVNTNDDWYYVLGRREGGFSLDYVKSGAVKTAYDKVAGDKSGMVSPVGTMLCLWCDEPGAEFTEEEFADVRTVLSRFALGNPEVFELPPPELNRDDHCAYISGYPDGTVRPGGSLSRAETAAILYRLLTEESLERHWSELNDFTDVEAGTWYNAAVSTLAAAGILAGYADGTFRPDAAVSRGEFAAVISRFAGEQDAPKCSFYDVPDSHWAAGEIAIAENMGWIGGYPDGSFRPSQTISRAEAVAIINRVLRRAVKADGVSESARAWSDNPPGTWYYSELQEAGISHSYVRSTERVPERDYNYEKWIEVIE